MVCSQNHDQVGNRAFGERTSALISLDALKVAAAAVLLSPQTPMLFMGEEYGETAPFLYFTDHGDPALVEAVRNGRREEFAAFGWSDEIPDPQDVRTFERSRLALSLAGEESHASLLRWYGRLITLRKTVGALGSASSTRHSHRVWQFSDQQVLVVHRQVVGEPAACIVLGFNRESVTIALSEPYGKWSLALDSGAKEFGGDGAAHRDAFRVAQESRVTLHLSQYPVLLYLAESGCDAPTSKSA